MSAPVLCGACWKGGALEAGQCPVKADVPEHPVAFRMLAFHRTAAPRGWPGLATLN